MIRLPEQLDLSVEEYQTGLKTANEFHGHLCGGMFTGVKMALCARRILGYPSFPSKDLLVIAEIDRCLTDAVMAITGCRFGRRTLKFRDYGKFAAEFHSLEQNQGVRISQKDGAYRAIETRMESEGIDRHDYARAGMVYFHFPIPDQFQFQIVQEKWDENDLPGFPKIKVNCAQCGETVMDNRHVEKDGKLLCRPCSITPSGPVFTGGLTNHPGRLGGENGGKVEG